MEINKSQDITGVKTTEDIVEGRMVLFTSNPGVDGDLTGRMSDVPGVKLPDTTAEAARARFCLTWQVDNRQPPLVDWPSYNYALRQGFDQTANTPITGKTIYMTYPGYQESVTIPSGTLSLAFGGDGTVLTVPSGQYIYDATMQVPGTRLRVADTASDSEADAGKLAVVGSGTEIAEVERFDSSTYALTIRLL